MAMIQLSEPELKPLMTDMTKPILVRIIAKNLLDKKGFDIIERMIDRAHGKAAMTMGEDENNSIGSLAEGLLSLSKVKQKAER